MYEFEKFYFSNYLVKINLCLSQQEWKDMIRENLGYSYLVENDIGKIGFYRFSIEEKKQKHAHLRMIAVCNESRYKGYGTRLYEHFEKIIKRLNLTRIKLSCPVDFESNKWYPKIGYKKIDRCGEKNIYEKEITIN